MMRARSLCVRWGLAGWGLALAGCQGDGYAERTAVASARPAPRARPHAPPPATPPAVDGQAGRAPPASPGAATSGAAAPKSSAAGALPVSAEDRAMFDEANGMRAQYGLRALKWNDRLYRAARDHSAEQDRYHYMGHGSPDPARDDLGDRVRIAGYGQARQWAEIVAWGYEGPKSVILGWMNSKGHRAILLDGGLEEGAFSRVGDYFTGDFASPRR